MKVHVPKVRADRGVTGELVPAGVAVGVLGAFLGPK